MFSFFCSTNFINTLNNTDLKSVTNHNVATKFKALYFIKEKKLFDFIIRI